MRRYPDAISSLGQHRFDVVFVDGRFRVACALRALWFVDTTSVVLVHDWVERQGMYGPPVLQFYDQVGRRVLANCKHTRGAEFKSPLHHEFGWPWGCATCMPTLSKGWHVILYPTRTSCVLLHLVGLLHPPQLSYEQVELADRLIVLRPKRELVVPSRARDEALARAMELLERQYYRQVWR